MDKWVQITLNDAILYCERAGFKCKEIDLFSADIKEFYLPKQPNIQFKYKTTCTDPMKFYILPIINDKVVTFDEFVTAVMEVNHVTKQTDI